MKNRNRSALGLVFLTVFLDMVGFSVIFPLFPAMLEHYLAHEGEASVLGRTVQQLAALVDGNEFAVATLFGSLLGSLYSALQFVFAPFWGALSDRIGRRPTLLVTLAGTAVSYLLWFFAGSFGMLCAARLLGGVMAGNVSTASAVVADVSDGPARAKGMGLLGAGIGLGFVFGPALGGLAVQFDVLAAWPGGTALGVNPFSGAAAAAFALALVNFLWALLHFPETLPAGGSSVGHARPRNPFRALRAIDLPGVRRTNLAYFLYLTAFSAIEFTLTFLAVERLGYGPMDNAKMFVFVGLVIALVQGGAVRRLAPRYGERRLGLAGLALTIPGFALVGAAHGGGTLYAGLAAMAVGSALVMPCLSALVSRYSPADRQGLALGTFRSMGALSRALGPAIGGALYWRLGSAAPYYAGGAFLLLPLVLAAGLPPVPETTAGAPEGVLQSPGDRPD